MRKNLREIKSKVPYDKLDPGIKRIVKLFNNLNFCATTNSCEGHPDYIGGGYFSGNFYLTFEITNEEEFWKMFQEITPAFTKETDSQLIVAKELSLDNAFHYRISCWYARGDKKEVQQKLYQARKVLERLVLDYERSNRNVLE